MRYLFDFVMFVAILTAAVMWGGEFYSVSSDAYDLFALDIFAFTADNGAIYGAAVVFLIVFGIYHFFKHLVLAYSFRNDFREARMQSSDSIELKRNIYRDIRKSILYEVIVFLILIFSIHAFIVEYKASIEDPLALAFIAAMCFGASGIVMGFTRYMQLVVGSSKG